MLIPPGEALGGNPIGGRTLALLGVVGTKASHEVTSHRLAVTQTTEKMDNLVMGDVKIDATNVVLEEQVYYKK